MAVIDQNILNEVKSLEAFFTAGAKAATGLRKKLEGFGLSASPSGVLDEQQKANLLAKAEKRRNKKISSR